MESNKDVFTPEEVESLNKHQHAGQYHPFTCEPGAAGRKSRSECPDGEGILVATTKGWVCPCGAHKQGWAHDFMKS